MNHRSRTLTLAAITMAVLASAATVARGQDAPKGEKALPLCIEECMPICTKISGATPGNCGYACVMGCSQLQGRGNIGLEAVPDKPRPVPSANG